MINHTPLPYEKAAIGSHHVTIEAVDKDANEGHVICRTYGPDREANAALIVKCVNEYENLKMQLSNCGYLADGYRDERDELKKLNAGLAEALEEIKRKTFFHMVHFADERGDRKVLGEVKEMAIEALERAGVK